MANTIQKLSKRQAASPNKYVGSCRPGEFHAGTRGGCCGDLSWCLSVGGIQTSSPGRPRDWQLYRLDKRVASMADLRQQSVDADLGGAHVRLPRFRSHPSPMRGQATHLSIPSKGEWTFGGQGAPSYDGETRSDVIIIRRDQMPPVR